MVAHSPLKEVGLPNMRCGIRPMTGLRGYALAAALLATTAAEAGIGAGTSGHLVIDTLPPVLQDLVAPTGMTFASPSFIVFSWNLQDDSPTLEVAGLQADVVGSGAVIASIDLEFHNGLHSWSWPVAEIASGSCHLRVTARDRFGNETVAEAGDFQILLPGTGTPPTPLAPFLAAPAPNPFNPQTDLAFEIGRGGIVRLAIHDTAGRLVRELQDGPMPAGRHVRAWDGRDDAGRRVSGGAYLVRLTVDGRAAASRKVVLLP
jgi:hypothetical protein